jgi:hypothetical protein
VELDPEFALEVSTITINGVKLTQPRRLIEGAEPFPSLVPASGSPLTFEKEDHH